MPSTRSPGVYFLAGVGVGAGLSMVLALLVSLGLNVLLAVGGGVVAGALAGFAAKPSRQTCTPPRLQRAYAFPQGPLYIEIALRRSGFVRSRE